MVSAAMIPCVCDSEDEDRVTGKGSFIDATSLARKALPDGFL